MFYIHVGEIKDNKLRIGTTEVDVYNPENKTKVPDVLFYENTQVGIEKKLPYPNFPADNIFKNSLIPVQSQTFLLGSVAQSVTCLATDLCLTADPGVASSIPVPIPVPVRPHTFVEIDHEMISTVILVLPLIHSRRVVVSYKRKYVHELPINRLFKPAQEKGVVR